MSIEFTEDALHDLMHRLPQGHPLQSIFKSELGRKIRGKEKARIEYDLTHCKYDIPWGGRCKTEIHIGSDFCDKHSKEKCWNCKEQAIAGCSHAGQFVCGMPMCKEHPHHS